MDRCDFSQSVSILFGVYFNNKGRVVWFYTKFVGSIAIFNQVYYSNPNLNYFTTEMMKILLLCYYLVPDPGYSLLIQGTQAAITLLRISEKYCSSKPTVSN